MVASASLDRPDPPLIGLPHAHARPRPTRRLQIGLALLFLGSLVAVTPALRGDGVGYYAYITSLWIDGDLDFDNQYRHADPAHCQIYFDRDGRVLDAMRTPRGYLRNPYSVGPALLWIPFFALADAGVRAYDTLVPADRAVASDGYSFPYLWLCAVGSACLGFLGLYFAWRVACGTSGTAAGTGAMLGIWLASNLPVYMYLLPFLSHAHAAFVNSAFVWYWWQTWIEPTPARPLSRTSRQWGLLGFLAGLVFATYFVGALLWIFVAIDGLVLLRCWQREAVPWGERLRRVGQLALPFALGAGIAVLPHMVLKSILYGSPLGLGEYGDITWLWSSPNLLRVLFSAEHGLWTWTPVLLLACLGLVSLVRREPALGWRSALSFALVLYLMGAKVDWHGGSSFSNRYFLILTPIFVIGLAEFLRVVGARIEARRPGWGAPILGSALLLLALWNAGFIYQWAANVVPNRGPVSFAEVARNQVITVPRELARNAEAILFDRRRFVQRVETEDLKELDVEARPGICKP